MGGDERRWFRRHHGLVTLGRLVHNGGSGSNMLGQTMLVLPVGYRPRLKKFLPCNVYKTSENASYRMMGLSSFAPPRSPHRGGSRSMELHASSTMRPTSRRARSRWRAVDKQYDDATSLVADGMTIAVNR